MQNIVCSTCNTHVMAKDNFVRFGCPGCGQDNIVRCQSCKNVSNKYVCKKCDFTGP